MQSRSAIVAEINKIESKNNHDIVRRKYLEILADVTGHDVISYATDFTTINPIKAQFGGGMQIGLPDKDMFDEVTKNLSNPKLDIVLHSPGGSAEATESIVELLRSRFEYIRVIVPSAAKSAATMLAMAANELVIDEKSELGPTDPQMLIQRDNGLVVAPAQAILDQFAEAQKEINGDPNQLPGWVPILREYAPALLSQCRNHITLSEELVSEWLNRYMFADESPAQAIEKSERIASYLASHENFHSHNRRIGITKLIELGVKVLDTRTDAPLRSAISDFYTSTTLTFDGTGAFKILENSRAQEDTVIHQIHVEAVKVEESSQGTKAGKAQRRGRSKKR